MLKCTKIPFPFPSSGYGYCLVFLYIVNSSHPRWLSQPRIGAGGCIHACAKASILLLQPSPSHFSSPIASRVCSKRAEFSVSRGCFRIRVFEAKGRGDRTYLIAKLGQLVESVCACGSCRSNVRGGATNSEVLAFNFEVWAVN